MRHTGLVPPGYAPRFLDTPIPPPDPGPRIAGDLVDLDGSPVIDYTHFSLAQSRSRRLARWVAWNVDGARLRELDRSGLRFRYDERLDRSVQTGDEAYRDNRLDRGHIARRADLCWGDPEEARAANADSFYFTNITPQMDDFNQASRDGVWGRLENALLSQVEVDRLAISVFGGPVLSDADPMHRGVAVPVEHWKIICYAVDGTLRARAFLFAQQVEPVLKLDGFAAWQVEIGVIAERTELIFPDMLGAAPTARPQPPRPLSSTAEIDW